MNNIDSGFSKPENVGERESTNFIHHKLTGINLIRDNLRGRSASKKT